MNIFQSSSNNTWIKPEFHPLLEEVCNNKMNFICKPSSLFARRNPAPWQKEVGNHLELDESRQQLSFLLNFQTLIPSRLGWTVFCLFLMALPLYELQFPLGQCWQWELTKWEVYSDENIMVYTTCTLDSLGHQLGQGISLLFLPILSQSKSRHRHRHSLILSSLLAAVA